MGSINALLKMAASFKRVYFNAKYRVFWIRFFGSGIHVRDLRKIPLLFSERNGLDKGITVFNYRISLLK